MAGENAEGTLTITRIVDEVLDAMHGYVRDQNQVTDTTLDMTDTDASFHVSEPGQVSRGLVEIDDELMYVKNVATDGTVAVFGWGRGQSGTIAAPHLSGAPVRMAPLYPRQRVRDQIFACLRDIHPDIAPVAQLMLDVNLVRTNYPMPTDAYQILNVEWHPVGPSQMWAPVKRWRQNRNLSPIELELIGPAWPGSDRARVLYLRNLPDTFAPDEDLTALGYQQDLHSLLVLGACYRLLAYTEPSRIQVQSVQAAARSEFVPAGSTTNAAKFIYGLYLQKFEELRFAFAQRYPLGPKQTW